MGKWSPGERAHVSKPRSERLGLLLRPKHEAWPGERAHVPPSSEGLGLLLHPRIEACPGERAHVREPPAKLGKALVPSQPPAVHRRAFVQGPSVVPPREEPFWIHRRHFPQQDHVQL